MSDEPTQTHDSLAPLLAAFDEGVAVGREPELVVPPELADDFAAARSVLRLLNEAWPRPRPADTTVDQAHPAPPTPEVPRPSRCGWADSRCCASWARAVSVSSTWPTIRRWPGALR